LYYIFVYLLYLFSYFRYVLLRPKRKTRKRKSLRGVSHLSTVEYKSESRTLFQVEGAGRRTRCEVEGPYSLQHATDMDFLNAAHNDEVSNMTEATARGSADQVRRTRRTCRPISYRPPTDLELSKCYVTSSSETPMCDSDIDSSRHKPPIEMPNSTNRRGSSSQVRPHRPVGFGIHVLTKSRHRPNYRRFTS
jgi:hypothetical protein